MASETVIERLKAGGILSPKLVVAEAARAGLPLEVAAALLQKESAGGHNVFGHDRDSNREYIFPARDGTVKVTKELYLEYKRKRIASSNKRMQGVGPCQLTWWEFQDDADREGGCWRPQINMRIGFRRMASLMKTHGEALGAERYNGSGPDARKYSEDLLELVAAWKARLGGAAAVPVPVTDGPLRLGSRGPKVVRLTRRLARARSKAGTPYLAKPRRELDAVAEAALKAFQAEHRLEPDGVYGPLSQRKLNRVLRLQAKPPAPVPADKPVVAARPKLKALVAEVQRYDAETGEAWDRLVAHAARRRKQLRQVKAGPAPAEAQLNSAVAEGFAAVTAILKEIDGTLDTLVAERETAEAPAAAVPAVALAGGAGDGMTVVQAPPPAPQAPEGPAPPSPAAIPPPARRRLTDLSDRELLERIEKLDRALDRSRAVLISRFAATEKELHKVAPPKQRVPGAKPKPKPQVVVKPVPKRPPEPSRADVKALQTALNKFTEKRLELAPLIVDGVKGVATKRRIRAAKFYLGYSRANAKSAVVDEAFLRRLKHPRSARHSSPAMLARAIKRRRAQRKGARLSSGPAAGVATFDGKPVAAWLKPYLVWARNNGWQGQLNSGWRDPAYSEQLCRNMCGAPRCPGKCAGRTSNHAGSVKPAGAVDVSDYVKFGELMRRCPLEPRIFNALGARDPVHFSASGN